MSKPATTMEILQRVSDTLVQDWWNAEREQPGGARVVKLGQMLRVVDAATKGARK